MCLGACLELLTSSLVAWALKVLPNVELSPQWSLFNSGKARMLETQWMTGIEVR